jgi:putative phosphoribosyl transferase
LVDDGVATGSTITAASKWIKGQNSAMLITALPIIPQKKIEVLSRYSNIIKFIRSPRNFNSVDEFYKDFGQVDDDTLMEILEKRDLL